MKHANSTSNSVKIGLYGVTAIDEFSALFGCFGSFRGHEFTANSHSLACQLCRALGISYDAALVVTNAAEKLNSRFGFYRFMPNYIRFGAYRTGSSEFVLCMRESIYNLGVVDVYNVPCCLWNCSTSVDDFKSFMNDPGSGFVLEAVLPGT